MNAIERTAREALPVLADFCLVHVVSGARLPCVAAVHVSRRGQTQLRALMRHHSIRGDDLVSSVAHVIRTQRPMLRTRVHEETNDRGATEAVAELHRRLAARSVLVVPIVGGAAVIGALSLCYSASGRSYGARHLAPARRIAARLARDLMAGPTGGLAAAQPRQGRFVRRRVAARH